MPKGNYDVWIRGEAEEGVSEVKLEVEASTTIKTNSEGLYELSYDTSCIPTGRMTVEVDGYKKAITFREEATPMPLSPFKLGVTPYIIESSTLEEALKLLRDLQPEEIAQLLEEVSPQRAGEILSSLDMEKAFETLMEMPLNSSIEAIIHTSLNRTVEFFEALPTSRGASMIEGLIRVGKSQRVVEVILKANRTMGSDLLMALEASSASKILEEIVEVDASSASELVEEGFTRSTARCMELLEELKVETLTRILIEMV